MGLVQAICRDFIILTFGTEHYMDDTKFSYQHEQEQNSLGAKLQHFRNAPESNTHISQGKHLGTFSFKGKFFK